MDKLNGSVNKWELKTVEKKFLHGGDQANFKYLLTNGDIVFSCDGIEYKGPLQKIVDTLNAAESPAFRSRRETSEDFSHAIVKLYAVTSVALCRVIRQTGYDHNSGVVWKTRFAKEKDSESNALPKDIFIMGVGLNKTESETICFFLPLKKWDECWFARELEQTPFPMNSEETIPVDQLIKLLDAL